MRPQETAALKGRHIQDGMIVIEQALKKDGSIDRPKTDEGIRRVPVPDELEKYFAKIKPFEFCFKSFDGKELNHRNMRTMWKSFKREMQIEAGCRVYRNKLVAPYPVSEELVPYCYRHTFATDCAAADMPIIKLQKLMGHTSIQTTSRYYIDMTDEMLKDAAETMKLYRQK
jgi:integrase